MTDRAEPSMKQNPCTRCKSTEWLSLLAGVCDTCRGRSRSAAGTRKTYRTTTLTAGCVECDWENDLFGDTRSPGRQAKAHAVSTGHSVLIRRTQERFVTA